MKKSTAKKKFIIIATVVAIFILLGIGLFLLLYPKKPLTSGEITKENSAQIYEILHNAGLTNVDTLAQWVEQTTNNTPNNDNFTDADCRMTVMLLAGKQIKYQDLDQTYSGDYLMFDLDAIDHDKNFALLKPQRQLFTTMFGEMPISAHGFEQTLSEQWQKYGIKLDSQKYSIISILFKTLEKNEAFVGHTGILIDCRDEHDINANFLFIEKIAFGDPFQITLLENEDELVEIFSQRSDYTPETGDPNPVVYKNDQILAELEF